MVHRRGLHRKFRLRRRRGREKLLITFDTTIHRKPTNLLLVRISAPTESVVSCDLYEREYLWSHEFWGTAECVGCISISHLFLTQSVISNLDVSIQCKQNIIQLQISIDNFIPMQVLKRQ